MLCSSSYHHDTNQKRRIHIFIFGNEGRKGCWYENRVYAGVTLMLKIATWPKQAEAAETVSIVQLVERTSSFVLKHDSFPFFFFFFSLFFLLLIFILRFVNSMIMTEVASFSYSSKSKLYRVHYKTTVTDIMKIHYDNFFFFLYLYQKGNIYRYGCNFLMAIKKNTLLSKRYI